MPELKRDVVVVGGGISGLTCAWRLHQAGVDVCLLEGEAEVGGCTRTEQRDGFLLEKGPFNIIVRDPTFESLLEDLSNGVSVVPASRAARVRYIYRRGRLHPVPTNPVALMTTGLLGVGARVRLLSGLMLSGRGGRPEETIEQVATRRVGRQASDTIVSAAISGIFAGDIRRLNLDACFPTVARIDGQARSLIGYGLRSAFGAMMKKNGARRRRRWRGLVSIDGGLGALTSALGLGLGRNVLSGCTVKEANAADDGGYSLALETGDGATRVLQCRRLVLGTSALEASRCLEAIAPEAAPALASIESSSLAVLNLGFRLKDVGHPLEGFGFLVPHNEPEFPLMGVLWADSIFPHHAPPDHRLLRVFIGGAHHPEAMAHSDDEMLAIAMGTLRKLLDMKGDPVLVDVCRYPAAIPQYYFGHREKIEDVRAAVAKRPGLHLIGNYLEGVSLNDCVRVATQTAEEMTGTNGRAPDEDRVASETGLPVGAEAAAST
jgi:oxygen-dependent protoporphyrinogen oxidase